MRHYLRHLDYLLIATAVSISAFGLWIIKNSTASVPGNLYAHQLLYDVVGAAGMLIVAAVPPSFVRRMLWPLYGFVILSCTAVLAVGVSVLGGQRWISLGPFQFQPSEFSKLLLTVGLAALLAGYRNRLSPGWLTLAGLAFVGLPALLVFKEPDLGTTLVLLAMLLGVLFVYGASWRHFAAMGLTVVVVATMALSILPSAGIHVVPQYQIDRFTSFLQPTSTQFGTAGYQLEHSKLAIQHGGVTGTGPAGATETRLGYVPVFWTDFIFAVVGEERGFVGAAWLLGLYALMLWRGLKLITYSRSTFGSLVAAGVVSILTFQVFVNVGMTIGLAPITGIPLPFMSYGGSSTVTNFLAVGVLLAIHVHAQQGDEGVVAL
ncbi:MAG TPA: FtsW/RodA/SpoVE family cell cycle protein [Gaiellales bacterium]|nr:FtsW/RodA/SpoVE family cell cycle protein [Gaiellales bacterium]